MNLSLLIATLAALLSGPLLYAILKTRPRLTRAMDGFVLVSVTGLVLIDVVPEAYGQIGLWSLLFVGLGLLGPTLLEHLLSHARRGMHIAAMTLVLVGLVLHSFGDGVALSPAGGQANAALGIAVAIHSIPVGLLVWWLMAPVFGPLLPACAIAAMCAGTVGGYVTGIELGGLNAHAWAGVQALIAGTLLHVAFGRPHSHAGKP
ncbi:MAG: hypothetical protein ACRETM_07500 [Stenotrophobium sp.]